jgi:hypothetical protein
MNTTQDIINKIAKLKDAIEGETDPDIKAKYSSKLASLEAEINKAEEIVEVKIEKQEVAEQKNLSEAEVKIKKLKDAIDGETDPDIKARYQKKLKELQGDLGEVKQEIKEEKKEIAEQKKEIKKAVKEVKSVEKVVRKQAVKKVTRKVAERKKVIEVKKPKRKTKLTRIMSDLDALIRSNKKLKERYRGKTGLPAGQRVDLKRDAKRSAKPFGWRFTGKYDYRDPKKVLTARQFENAKKRGTLDYEARPNRSDVYPAGYKGKKKLVKGRKVVGGVKRALADGGMMAKGGEVMPEWAVTITSKSGRTFDWVGHAKNEDAALHKAEMKAGFESVETGINMITDERGRKVEYAKGGKMQGYDDRQDERLGMKHGKISKKDFVGTTKQKEHSRRDDSRFEERMANGGVFKSKYPNGNLYKYGRSWRLDHAKHNKKEDYEIPMKKRKRKY